MIIPVPFDSIRRRWFAAAVLALSLAVILPACSSSSESTGQPWTDAPSESVIRHSRIELSVLLIGVDVTKAQKTVAYKNLLECAELDESPEVPRRATSWSEIESYVRTLRAANAIAFASQPSLRVRSGSRSTVQMQSALGGDLTVTLRASERPTGGVSVDVGARFQGDERTNRFEDLEFDTGQLTLSDRRVAVESGEIQGAEMWLSMGQVRRPGQMRVMVFVSANTVVQ